MSALTADMQFILTLLIFVTGVAGLWIPLIAFGGLAMGLIMIPYVDPADFGLIALHVMALVVNVLFFIVGTVKARRGG